MCHCGKEAYAYRTTRWGKDAVCRECVKDYPAEGSFEPFEPYGPSANSKEGGVAMAEQMQHNKWFGLSKHGKSTALIECPYCKTEVTAYIWSLHGTGKKCPECGAIHNGFGLTRSKDSKEVDSE